MTVWNYLPRCSSLTVIAVAFGSYFVSGCGEQVTFNVLSPAKVNVKKLAGTGDSTVSVGEWKSDGGHDMQAQEIKQYLREAITNAEGGVVKFADSNGVVRLDGTLSEHSYNEEVTRQQQKCTRREGGKNVDYSCTVITRKGNVRVRASMNAVGRDGNTLSAVTEPCEQTETTSATDAEPQHIDPEPIFLNCRRTIAAAFARNVVPYRVNVTKPWFKCGAANDHCKGALAQLRAGNFDQAKDLLDQGQKLVASDPEALAGVEWGLTLIAEFSSNYADAEDHAKRASQLKPTETAFAAELGAIREREKQNKELEDQGVHQTGGEE